MKDVLSLVIVCAECALKKIKSKEEVYQEYVSLSTLNNCLLFWSLKNMNKYEKL